MPPEQVIQIALDVTRGMLQLHEQHVPNKDIRPVGMMHWVQPLSSLSLVYTAQTDLLHDLPERMHCFRF